MLDAIKTKSELKVLTAKKSLDKEIKEFNQKPIKTKSRVKRYLFLICLLALVGLSFYITFKINQFFENNKLVFQSPVKVGIYTPVYITKREKVEAVTIVKEVKGNSPLTPDQQYLCDKFKENCKIALAIQKAENGTGQCDRINWSNKDQSLDIGFMQINTLWIDKNIFKPAQLFDCKTNTDAAYEIFKRWGGEKDPVKGFGAWATFNNQSYKKFMY